ADGGLVLQTAAGFEAVRCSGLPERLVFDRVPAGLSAQPVFTIDTYDPTGGTYDVELTYLAWGFDWQAHYVATLASPGGGDEVRLRLLSWLTLLNDNGQSFANAELLVVAGRLNVVSNFQALADPPDARPLQLTCYPLGSTAAATSAGSIYPPSPPAAPPPPPMAMAEAITVTAARAAPAGFADAALGMKAAEEALGDLKLYRVPERVTVAAKALKQIAFLDQGEVRGRLLYQAECTPHLAAREARPAGMMLETVNEERHGLGMALPGGGVTVFEPSAFGEQLVAEASLRDHAEGQDVELAVGSSAQVQVQCDVPGPTEGEGGQGPAQWLPLRANITNANPV